jgi:hypothetical protein
MQRSQLLRLRPDFPDVFPDDIDDLLSALSEASYEWSDTQMAFVNSDLQKAIHTRRWWTTDYPPRVEMTLVTTTLNPVAEWRSR